MKLARINLTDGSIAYENMDEQLTKKFIGGRGLATKMLYDEGIAGVDPLSPDNKMIIIAGPLTGTTSPTAGRYMVATKSPLNNMIACANSGGTWGAKLKYAGLDALVIEGKASAPVYMSVENGKVDILPADDLWGKLSRETSDVLKERHGTDTSVLNIGPAGEHLSLLSCVMNDVDRAAGRGGVGAVMGSKNLKSIIVRAANKNMPASDPEAMQAAFKSAIEKIKANAVTSSGLPTYGTAVLVNIINGLGAFPYRNWQEAYDPDADLISGETLKEKYLTRNTRCHKCPIGCGREVKREGGPVGGPEYEPLWAYGASCAVHDMEAINEANHLCNEYGLDAIGAPATIAAAMELYQRSFIRDDECGGIPLAWGSPEAIVEWTRRMGTGDDSLSRLMADGSFRLCEHYGAPELSMSSKKQELPAYDARAIQGIGLNYATSNRGGCHVRGYTISPEVLGLPKLSDRTQTDDKPKLVKTFQDLTAVIDSLGLCLFTSFALCADDYAALLNAATGTDYTGDTLLEAGERIYNIERMFNKAAGMESGDDTIPERLLSEPIPDGPSKGMLSHLEDMLPKYYELRGWVNGFPTKETIARLELEDL